MYCGIALHCATSCLIVIIWMYFGGGAIAATDRHGEGQTGGCVKVGSDLG